MELNEMNLKQEFEDLNSDYFELWFKVLKGYII